METMLDFTITATLRLEVLQQTLSSFSKNIIDISTKECKCLINIDCAPIGYCDPMELVKLCHEFFKEVEYNISEVPNFCSSVKWLWSKATSPYIFHLEDDWELLRSLEIRSLIKIFEMKSDLYQIRLRKRTKEYGMWMYGLSPCLISRNFYSLWHKLKDIENPEVQLKNLAEPPEGRVEPYPFAVIDQFTKTPAEHVIVKDTGRDWRVIHWLSKPPKVQERSFVSWEKRKKILR